MMSVREPSEYRLIIKTVTWQKDSHSLFDYEYNKIVIQTQEVFDLEEKFLFIYRNNSNSEVYIRRADSLEGRTQAPGEQTHQLLGAIHLRQEGSKYKLEFFNSETVRAQFPAATAPTPSKDEDIYLIVRSLKDKHNENKGYKLRPGHIIKLGRLEYLVTSAQHQGAEPTNRSRFWMNKKRIVAEAVESGAGVECKYCMLGELEEAGGFLCSPCSCSGTCALVHFSCLEKWNRSKVKKEVVGGTTQYNFEKFNCEVCRAEYPRFIEKDGQEHELLPIDKPQGHHLVLESVSDKANNMMLLQDIEKEGVRIGRGHECEIRVADISVSRSHARIARVGSDYFIFDNKSKFGTLVKEPRLTLDLARSKQGVQVGRTVLTFEISKTSFEVNFAKHPAEE